MKRILSLICLAAGLFSGCTLLDTGALLSDDQIVRTVFFDLKYPVGSQEANQFLRYMEDNITQIPGVRSFQILRQSGKGLYLPQYRMSMRFKDKEGLEFYKRNVVLKEVYAEVVKQRLEYDINDFVPFDYRDAAPKK